MNRLSRFKSRHSGKRGVIVCNGPSLNSMELDFLRNEVVIGMNKIFLGLEQFKFYPRYLIAVNVEVVKQSAAALTKMNCVKFIPIHSAAVIPEDALVFHINTSSPPSRFCRDITRGVHEGWTVTYAALQVAFFLGFSEVVIIGMDHRYTYTGGPNEAHVLNGSDPNHFSPDYFGGGQTWHNPDLARSEESYKIARHEYERDGRRIIDATVGGACTVFEKADYREVFGIAL